jgi:hypothetical protein
MCTNFGMSASVKYWKSFEELYNERTLTFFPPSYMVKKKKATKTKKVKKGGKKKRR